MTSPRTRLGAAVCLFVAMALAPARGAHACDSTGCLLITRTQNGLVAKGAFSLDLSFRYLDESKKLRGSDEAAVVFRPRIDVENQRIIPAYHRDVDGSGSGIQLDAAYGLGASTSLFASLPLVTLKSHEIAHGQLVTPYDTWGIGDALVGMRQGLGAPLGGRLVAGLALKLPTGRNDVIDPFDQKIQDPVLQPGTGSFDALLSAQFTRRLGGSGVDLSLSGSYQANSTNGYSYRFGNEGIVTMGASRTLGRLFAASLQGKYIDEARDRFAGTGVPSSGSRSLYLTGGLRFFQGRTAYYTVLQLPVYRHVNESQLAPKAGVLAGVSRAF